MVQSKRFGIAFIGSDKSNSVKSFCEIGCGEEELFSKRSLPRITFYDSLSARRDVYQLVIQIVRIWIVFIFGRINSFPQFISRIDSRFYKIDGVAR